MTVKKYLTGLRSEEIAAATRGYALALGALPGKLVLNPPGTFTEILDGLVTASRYNYIKLYLNLSALIMHKQFCSADHRIGGEPDAETRRNALGAIVELTERLGVGEHGVGAAQVNCFERMSG